MDSGWLTDCDWTWESARLADEDWKLDWERLQDLETLIFDLDCR